MLSLKTCFNMFCYLCVMNDCVSVNVQLMVSQAYAFIVSTFK